MPSIEDHVLLLLAIKPPKKVVDLEHILEKVSRDSGATKDEIIRSLDILVSEGYIERIDGGFRITESGRRFATRFVDMEGLNRSYRLVLEARLYYPVSSEFILPFLRDRPVSVIKVFSDDNDPLTSIKPIFSRYRRRKPRVYNYVNSVSDIMRFVDMHVVDFIPYVHRKGIDYPDWFVIDIDAGDHIKDAGDLGFELTKEVTQVAAEVLSDVFYVKPNIKFSGSRGFQIWASFEAPLGSFEDYRKAVIVVQRKVEEVLEKEIGYDNLKEKYGGIFSKPLTTSTVAKKLERRKQILFDWSSLKPEGDVRAPFSIHYKTGLVSVPLNREKIMDFDFDLAHYKNVLNNIVEISNYFKLEDSPVDKIRSEVKKFGIWVM